MRPVPKRLPKTHSGHVYVRSMGLDDPTEFLSRRGIATLPWPPQRTRSNALELQEIQSALAYRLKGRQPKMLLIHILLARKLPNLPNHHQMGTLTLYARVNVQGLFPKYVLYSVLLILDDLITNEQDDEQHNSNEASSHIDPHAGGSREDFVPSPPLSHPPSRAQSEVPPSREWTPPCEWTPARTPSPPPRGRSDSPSPSDFDPRLPDIVFERRSPLAIDIGYLVCSAILPKTQQELQFITFVRHVSQ